MGGFAWVTLATNDSYSLGALVLAHSLRRAGTPHDLVALITPGVTNVMREKLAAVFSLVQEVNILDSKDESNLRLLARPELGITFTKLHCWRLTQYEKCVFVDADALVIKNCDELFEREELSAAPDVGWPDCFNSGVFVFKPSQQTYDSLIAFATAQGSFDGGDQGLLNMFFSDWAQKDISKHLPFIYNMCSTATYSYLPAFKQFGSEVRIIHFIGSTKPWLQYLDTLTGIVQPPAGSTHLQPLLQIWWNIFCDNVHPLLNPDMATSTLAPPWHNVSSHSIISNNNHANFQNSTDETHSHLNFDKLDYSDFKDPWENYSPQLDPFLRDPQQVIQETSENLDLQQRHCHKSNSSFICQESQFQESQRFIEEPRNFSDDKVHDVRNFLHEQNREQRFECKKEIENQNVIYENHNVQNSQDYNNLQDIQSCQERDHSSQQEYHSSQESSSHKAECHWKPHESQSHQESNISSEFHTHFSFEELPQQYCEESFVESHQNTSREILETGEIDNEKRQYRELVLKDDLENDKLTDTDRLISPHPLNTRIIPKKVASQSEVSKIGEHLESNDAGLAGALSKLTLGEPRSNEQIAFEEHMRKQSWEQGQIDYLGRDSFENIWKKISETLATSPEREKSPPQDMLELKKTVVETPVEVKSEKLEEPAVGNNETTEQKMPSVVSTPITTDFQELVPAIVPQKIVEKQEEVTMKTEATTVALVDVEKVTPSEEVQKLLEPVKEAVSQQVQQPVPESVPESPIVPAASLETSSISAQVSAILIPELVSIVPSLPPETSILEGKIDQATFVQEKPVPIQVAESVLQAELKESVSQVTSPVGEEAISSIVTAVQESALAVSEALIDPPASEAVAQKLENGCLDHQAEPLSTPVVSSPLPLSESSIVLASPSTEVASVITPTAAAEIKEEIKEFLPISTEKPKEAGESTEITKETIEEAKEATELKEKLEPTEVTEPKEKTEPEKKIEHKEASESKGETKGAKLERRKSSSMEKPLLPSCEPKLTVQIPQSQPCEISGLVQKPKEEKISESCAAAEKSSETEAADSPARPTRSKEMKVPPTPTVTEATPPTSPPIDPEKEAEVEPKAAKKAVKKVVKKQSTEESEDAEGESSGKKVTKKVVKKVVKKKEGSEAEGSAEKTKKVVKKTTTTTTTTTTPSQLETDKSVPETPPPGSSEVPVPPKRKVKSSSTTKGTTSKKSDTEL